MVVYEQRPPSSVVRNVNFEQAGKKYSKNPTETSFGQLKATQNCGLTQPTSPPKLAQPACSWVEDREEDGQLFMLFRSPGVRPLFTDVAKVVRSQRESCEIGGGIP